jgi:hypothetical protein
MSPSGPDSVFGGCSLHVRLPPDRDQIAAVSALRVRATTASRTAQKQRAFSPSDQREVGTCRLGRDIVPHIAAGRIPLGPGSNGNRHQKTAIRIRARRRNYCLAARRARAAAGPNAPHWRAPAAGRERSGTAVLDNGVRDATSRTGLDTGQEPPRSITARLSATRGARRHWLRSWSSSNLTCCSPPHPRTPLRSGSTPSPYRSSSRRFPIRLPVAWLPIWRIQKATLPGSPAPSSRSARSGFSSSRSSRQS